MKKTLITLIIAAFAALSVSSFGQAAGPAGGTPPSAPGAAAPAKGHGANIKRMEEALAKLNLSDQQKSQIKDLFGKAQVAHKELKQKVKSGQLSKDQAKTEIQKIGQQTREDLMKILTPAQKKELVAIMKAERKNKNKPGTPPPPPPTL